MNRNKTLAAVAIVQGVILLGQLALQPGSVRQASAETQVTNPSERQIAMLDELKSMNQKMERLTALLQSGELQVKVAKTDEPK